MMKSWLGQEGTWFCYLALSVLVRRGPRRHPLPNMRTGAIDTEFASEIEKILARSVWQAKCSIRLHIC